MVQDTVHIAGVNSVIADCLSHFQQDRFQQLAQLANPTPDTTPVWPIQYFIDASCIATILVLLRQHVKLTSQVLMPSLVYSHFDITPFPASSLTLEYFCAHASQDVSYKTLKIYQSSIRLAHIELGLPDPTESATLHLVCRGICRQQGDNQRTTLPSTINLLRTLKEQLQLSSYYTTLEQRMLWAVLTVAFYRFFRALTNPYVVYFSMMKSTIRILLHIVFKSVRPPLLLLLGYRLG